MVGGQVSVTEEATFDARLRGGKRVIQASIEEGELFEKKLQPA